MLISKPMLAATCKDVKTLTYPLAATVKLDGIRSLRSDTEMVSRTFKPIANAYINASLTVALPPGMDGEIMAGSNFQEVTHAVMSQDGTPSFVYNIFDYVKDACSKPYKDRMVDLENWYKAEGHLYPFLKVLLPTIINTEEELLAFEEAALADGYEGVMVRSLASPYKNGRGTVKEGYLLKVKRFSDSEAIVLDFDELMTNNNVATKDAFGRSERSSHLANLAGADTLGAILVRDVVSGLEFRIGTGFTAEQRAEIWQHRKSYLGQLLKYKFFSIGVKTLPRHPVALGFRSKDDM